MAGRQAAVVVAIGVVALMVGLLIGMAGSQPGPSEAGVQAAYPSKTLHRPC